MDRDDGALRSGERLLECARLLRAEIETVLLDDHGLTLADVQILHSVRANPRHCVQIGVLARSLVLAPSRVTSQIDRMEHRGLVQRIRLREDKRIVLVAITGQGLERLQAVLSTYAALVRRHYLEPLSRHQMIALGDSSRRVSEALRSQKVHQSG